jgi:hypothetical protein
MLSGQEEPVLLHGLKEGLVPCHDELGQKYLFKFCLLEVDEGDLRLKPGLRACLSKQFQWVEGNGWVGGARCLCEDKHWASTKQALFGSGPPTRVGRILQWRRNPLK